MAPYQPLIVQASDGLEYAGVTWIPNRGFIDPITNRTFGSVGLTIISWRYSPEALTSISGTSRGRYKQFTPPRKDPRTDGRTSMTLRQFMDVSTGHMSKSDMKLLEKINDDGDFAPVYEGPTGFFVWVDVIREDQKTSKIPNTVFRALKLVREHNPKVDYVCFDAHAAPIDYLRWFDH